MKFFSKFGKWTVTFFPTFGMFYLTHFGFVILISIFPSVGNYWCLNRHLCILPECFAKKDLNLVIVCRKDVMS